MNTLTHVRIIRSHGSRRINGRQGRSETLCGGEMTDRDATIGQARRDMANGWRWLTCKKCRAIMEARKRT